MEFCFEGERVHSVPWHGVYSLLDMVGWLLVEYMVSCFTK
jgi:hypothetical protein